MNTVIYVNLFTAVVVFGMGILFITGLLLPQVDFQTRLIFGVIFVSYGVYRFINVQAKRKILRQNQEHEKIKRAQEELIKKQRISK